MDEQKLLDLLKKKKGFFLSILDLTKKETFTSLNEWESILKQKRILLSCIDKIDKELTLFKDSLNSISQEISDELEKIKLIIINILEFDSINQKERKKTLLSYDKRNN